jgi:hypothetical protein
LPGVVRKFDRDAGRNGSDDIAADRPEEVVVPDAEHTATGRQPVGAGDRQ